MGDEDDCDQGWSDGVVQVLEEIEQYERLEKQLFGDVLVFLLGEWEICNLSKVFCYVDLKYMEILLLYLWLSNQEQNWVFQFYKGWWIVFLMNVVEMFLIVLGIWYVIDIGVVRISCYSVCLKI